MQNLSLFKPDIVHFSGHGQKADAGKGLGFGLVDRTNETAVIAEQGLLSLLRGLREDRPQLLLLASCWSLGIVRSATAFVKCGIGCPSNLNGTVAGIFIQGFYSAIASGRSIRDAYDIGVAGIPDSVAFERRPMLEWAHDVDPANVLLLDGRASSGDMIEIQRLLDLGLFKEALFRIENAQRDDPLNARLLFYSALARMNGRAPRGLVNLAEARSISALLEQSLKLSALGDSRSAGGWQGCALLFQAWIQEDLYQRRGFLAQDMPALDFLAERALDFSPEAADLQRLRRIFPSQEESRCHSVFEILIQRSPKQGAHYD